MKSSILNDVMGPIMRGPSSSHTAASCAIARESLRLLNEPLKKALVEFDKNGAWAHNYREQGTAMGMTGGLLGLDITDEQIKDTEQYALKKGIEVLYKISSFETNHINTVRLTLTGISDKMLEIIAISLGGGKYHIEQINREVVGQTDKQQNAVGHPFETVGSLLAYAEDKKITLGELGQLYEQSLTKLPASAINAKMQSYINVINESIHKGLAGTDYNDRILHQQSHLVSEAEQKNKILHNQMSNKIIAYTSAIMEAKSAMEVFVANPTAGSCGTVGGCIKALEEELKPTSEELLSAYFAAGMIGVYFDEGAGFSAEEFGCQVECGAASGMAAAALTELMGGSAKQAIDAASLSLQNMIGLICDPVADRVEVPCLGKNIMAAMNAYSSATMSLAGFDAVIPLDQVIETIARVGKQLPHCLKNTGTGGLAITEAARNIKRKLDL